jgi:predicted PurR-regulated permease PerM
VPGISTLVGIVTAVVAVAGLYFARDVLIPITLAILLSFVLAPIVDLLRKVWVPRAAAVVLSVLLALGVIFLVGTIIGAQVAGLAADLPRYIAAVQAKLAALQEFALGQLSSITGSLDHATPGGTANPATPVPSPSPGSTAPAAAPSSPLATVGSVLAPILHPLETTAIVLVVTIFVLLQRDDLRDRLIRLAGATDLHRTTTALDDAARRLSKYFLAQLTINACFGCVVATGLYFIGLPSPILWGIIAALLRFVPYVGTALGAALPIALAAAVDPGWTTALWTAAFFLAADLLTGQVVEPLVYGHSTGLSPVAVIIAAIFWSWLWGPIGLILSMPLTLCLIVLGRHVERLEFLDVLLGDRPALTPPEAFYQRMLADDPDEALDAAEAILRERPLSTYYDEVALKGLQLAANDAERGVLAPGRLERVRDSALSLIGDLAERPDTDPKPEMTDETATAAPVSPTSQTEQALPNTAPPPVPDAIPDAWRAEGAVLCIAGRGPLDEAGSAMLAQLLIKRGIGACLVPHDDVARARVRTLDITGAVMVCISYLEVSGQPAHLRYLIRRLRVRLPDAPVLVGLWPAEAPVLADKSLQAAFGADHYTSSLHDAVAACVGEANARGKAAGETQPGPNTRSNPAETMQRL